jgi:hypothetical protein
MAMMTHHLTERMWKVLGGLLGILGTILLSLAGQARGQMRQSIALDSQTEFALPSRPVLSVHAWRRSPAPAIRGITIGPIESSLHPNRGYGTVACARALREARRMGANWVSLTPFGRVFDLKPTGIDLSFEAPFVDNKLAVSRAVAQAHAEGLRVLLVPHLWVETGQWRGEIDPGDETGWERWSQSYSRFLLTWAHVARDAGVDMLAVGVELKSAVTTTHAVRFAETLHEVRSVYPGLLTYAGNWDDIEQTVILGQLDLIGVNAFYPLSDNPGAGREELMRGARQVSYRVKKLARDWHKPVLFTEFGYTTRTDPAVRPWEWPEHLEHVLVDEAAQAEAYEALLAAMISEPWFAGLFVWRVYADPEDVSQEAEWGFSPRGKLAELVLRDAFAAHWAADGARPLGAALHRFAAERVAVY